MADGFAVGMSADGSKVLFDSISADLVANDTNCKADIFIKDINNWPSSSC
ncbi:MAG: hypothetical protein IPG70_02080 [Moraxellaceae bacterium]|nr:hypothetical protein [Moraxellaceae bacterium]